MALGHSVAGVIEKRNGKAATAAASAYVVWSATCLVLSSVQATTRGLPRVASDALLVTGGPPLLLWSGLDGAWATYCVLTLAVLTLGGGAVTLWRDDRPLAVLVWLWTLVAWVSAGGLLWLASF